MTLHFLQHWKAKRSEQIFSSGEQSTLLAEVTVLPSGGVQNSEPTVSHRGLVFKEAGTVYPSTGLEKFGVISCHRGLVTHLWPSHPHVSGSVPETRLEEGPRRKRDHLIM